MQKFNFWFRGICLSIIRILISHASQQRPLIYRRAINWQGGLFVSFMPGVSRKALKHIRLVIRRMGLHLRTEKSLQEIAQMLNPVVLGWVNYFRHYYKSALHSVFYHINKMLMRWAMRKYKRRGLKRAGFWLERVKRNSPKLFAHWDLMPLMVRQ